jgi:5-methylthioadenosine/S-adenosylhomocysteine deaminase
MTGPEVLPADLAITRATVVTMDAARTVLDDATILVTGERITAVGPPSVPPAAAARTIDARGGIVVPGFVNAHTHLAMTMFRGVADDLDLERFLARLVPAEDAVLDDESVAAGTTLAVAECLRAGITTALDMYFFPEASTAAAAGSGLDVRNGPVFVEAAGPDDRTFRARIDWAGELLAATAPERRWVAPHSTYLLSDAQLAEVGALAGATGSRIHVHACETAAELAAVRARHGRTPIEVLADTGLLGPGTVLAHGVHLTDGDIVHIAEAGSIVTHCPASNQKLGSGLAPVVELRDAGVPVALGTDGAASANDLDLWVAMRLAAYPLAARTGPGEVSAHDVLAMATTAGARAIGASDRGSVGPGQRADLVVLDASSPSLTPCYDPVSTVAYAASRADVRWVVAGGRVVVDDHQLVTIDVDAAIDAVRRLGPAIRAATGAAARTAR